MLLSSEIVRHCCLLQHQERRPLLNEGPLWALNA